MKVLSTANIIGQAFKNAGRVKEIVAVFVTHGFAEIVHRLRLTKFLPGKYSENPVYKNLPTPERLRLAFEKLGTTYVKLGQVLAARPDLIPESYVQEFQKLQDQVKFVPFEKIKDFLEKELHSPLDQVFKEFESQPMAAASIAQVHGATLLSGERVAVKIQRPGIEKTVANDISILKGLAALLDHYIPESRLFDPIGLVEEFFRSIQQELDFNVEHNNIRKIRNNLKNFDRVAIPKVYPQSTRRVLVLERFDGARLSDRNAILASGVNPSQIVETGCDVFFHMVLKDGLFHGDLHAGNLFALPSGKIGIIDFGIVGRLSKRIKESVTTMFVALMDEDYESLASEYVYLSHADEACDLNRLQKDLMDLIAPYIGMSIGEVNVGHILMRSTAVATRHKLRLPRELMLLFKAIVTVEGLGKRLDPDFDLLNVGVRLARQALTQRYSKDQLLRNFIVLSRDIEQVIEMLPRLSKRFFRKWSQNGFAVETKNKDIEKLGKTLHTLGHISVLAFLGVSLYALGITLLILETGPTLWELPTGGPIFLLLGTGVFLNALLHLRKNGEKR